jgi:4-alpha-glucanotransferase
LQHLYWVPAGQPPASGAYVRYPMEELIGILALESHRHQCLIIGEDLGTVPEGFRERMTEAAILSYRVLSFEQDAESGALVLPAKYPYLALATFGSHVCQPCAAGGKDATSCFASNSISIPSRARPGGSARGAGMIARR